MTAAGRDHPRPIAIVGALSLAYEGLPSDLLESRAAVAATLVTRTRGRLGRPLVDLGVVTDLEGARACGEALAAADPAAVIVLSMGAIRADMGMALVARTAVPVVVWAVPDQASYPQHHRPVDAVAGAGPVGAYALSNALVRDGRRVRSDIGGDLDASTVAWLRAAGFAADLAGARFGLVGGRWPGMLDVHLDAERFERDLGGRWESVTLPDPEGVEPVSLDALATEIPSVDWSIPAVMDPARATASCRLVAALRAGSVGFDAVAVRCHSDAVGTHPGYGVMGCLGVSLQTSAGVPMTCTGDMVTAVAMLFASRVGGAAQYFEVDGPDVERGALMLSNGGEIDLRSARTGSVGLVEQAFFAGASGRGLACRGLMAAGPATLVAFTEIPSGWRLITLEGEVLDDHLAGFPVPHAFFRSVLDPSEAFRRLGDAGAPHHVALAPGHLGAVAAALATLVPLEAVAI